MAAPLKSHRYIVIGIIGLVAIQLSVTGLFGWKPSPEAGYFKDQSSVSSDDQDEVFDTERLKTLEAILAPAPVLAWSNAENQGEVPEGLASVSTLLSFADDQIKEDEGDDTDPALKVEEPVQESAQIDGQSSERASALTPELDDQVARLELAFNQPAKSVAPLEGKSSLIIKPIYFETLPDLSPLSADQRKKRFVAVLLPLILRANQELSERRQEVLRLIENGDGETLQKWADLYRIKNKPADVDQLGALLLKRVNTIPVSIALGQSAIESGWGTSRFALQGNALFGQWAWSQSAGIRPIEASNSKAVVRSFANLFDSVRAYMHNLNTHHSYQAFRDVRMDETADYLDLIDTLINYSEERDVYVDKLKSIIMANDFDHFDQARLGETG